MERKHNCVRERKGNREGEREEEGEDVKKVMERNSKNLFNKDRKEGRDNPRRKNVSEGRRKCQRFVNSLLFLSFLFSISFSPSLLLSSILSLFFLFLSLPLSFLSLQDFVLSQS